MLSPLLANVVLNRLDWFLQGKRLGALARARNYYRGGAAPDVHFARYADDWCVFVTRGDRRLAERLRDEIRQFLAASCGLELSMEKTRVTHVGDGFDFLGFRLVRETGRHGARVPKIKVGAKARKNIRYIPDETPDLFLKRLEASLDNVKPDRGDLDFLYEVFLNGPPINKRYNKDRKYCILRG